MLASNKQQQQLRSSTENGGGGASGSGSLTAPVCRRLRYFPTVGPPIAGPVATHVPPSVRCPPVLDPFGRSSAPHPGDLRGVLVRRPPQLPPDPAFSWLDRQVNNNSGESSSRRVAAKETSRREVENWCHMHFRFRMDSYQSLVYAIKQSAKDDSLFNEDHLDKWTLKMKFRIRRASPLKMALLACVSRLGLENDADVIFCTDGFYGDALTGRLRNKNEVPNRVVHATSTCRAMGLSDGSCLFVSRASRAERDNATAQAQLDLLHGQDGDAADSEGCDDESLFQDLVPPDGYQTARPETFSDSGSLDSALGTGHFN